MQLLYKINAIQSRICPRDRTKVFMIIFKKIFSAKHFIYYIYRSIATKVDSTYLGY